MMTQFGWSDTLYALSSCLACTTVSSSTDSLHNYAQHAHGPRRSSTLSRNREGRDRNRSGASRLQFNTRPLSDGLRPLLLEESTDDEYTDTLSLHSNVGGKRDGRSRYSHVGSVVSSEADGDTSALVSAKLPKSKSKGEGKGKKRRQDDGLFTVLGYDLFGKRKPAIQLPLTDDEEEDIGGNNGRMRRTQSGGTLDSDAAPLDDEAIAALSHAHIAGQGQRDTHIKQDEEEEDLSELRDKVKRAKNEGRRRGRRERKEREALQGALMTGMSNSHQEFEGFQGSGDGVLLAGFKSPSASASSMGTETSVALEAGDVDEETLVDLDGSLYARTVSGIPGTNAIIFESQTTSSTTTRGSNNLGPHRRSRSDHFHDDMFNPAFQHPNPANELQKKKSKFNRKKPTLSSSFISASTSTGTRSPSLPSPTGSTSLGAGLSHSISLTQSGSQAHQHFPQPSSMTKDGKFIDIPKQERLLYSDNVPSVITDSRGFPSVGFGVTGRRRGDSQSNGAFLARRGEN